MINMSKKQKKVISKIVMPTNKAKFDKWKESIVPCICR